MSQDAVERFLGRLLTDDEFRESARQSLLKTCVENDFEMTMEEKEIVAGLDFDGFGPLAAALNKQIRRCGLLSPAGEEADCGGLGRVKGKRGE